MSGLIDSATSARHRRLLLGAAAGLVVVLGWAWLSREPATAAGPAAGPPAVAVETAVAARRDVPVYLEGLGNVQAFYTAKITARVDGQLERVGFVEGQVVKKGDLLAQIDPRPLQAALDQATGMQAKDAAQLESAKRDLQRYMVLAPQNLTSQQVLDTQRALVAQLQAQLQVDQGAIDNARLCEHHRTLLGPHRHPPGRPRQHRPRQRHHRHRRGDANAADIDRIHAARGSGAADQPGAGRGRSRRDGAVAR